MASAPATPPVDPADVLERVQPARRFLEAGGVLVCAAGICGGHGAVQPRRGGAGILPAGGGDAEGGVRAAAGDVLGGDCGGHDVRRAALFLGHGSDVDDDGGTGLRGVDAGAGGVGGAAAGATGAGARDAPDQPEADERADGGDYAVSVPRPAGLVRVLNLL